MLDRHSLKLLQPLFQWIAFRLQRLGLSANQMTVAALLGGLTSALCIANTYYLSGLALLLLARLCDGLDGHLARLTQPTDLGAFLDIVFDFLFYASIPLAFAWANPAANSLAAATLLAAFIGTGSSFLAYAIFAKQRGLTSTTLPNKGFFFLGGLTEGTETIVVFCVMALWPQWFASIAYGFALLCSITIASRIRTAVITLK